MGVMRICAPVYRMRGSLQLLFHRMLANWDASRFVRSRRQIELSDGCRELYPLSHVCRRSRLSKNGGTDATVFFVLAFVVVASFVVGGCSSFKIVVRLTERCLLLP